MTLTRRRIERLGADADGAEDERLAALAEAFADGSWTVEDVEWIVRWKSSRVMGYYRRNDPADVIACVERAIDATRIGTKLDHLTSLDGVGVRVASAILTFMDPTRFTVLDWRAWEALYGMGYLLEPFPSRPDRDAYLLYLGASWALAKEFDVSLRTLDRALWTLGGEA